jgi:hypothetical protein
MRPPSCARPTISSLRKMNRTFSLNNVSDTASLLNASSTTVNESQINPQASSSNFSSIAPTTTTVVANTSASIATIAPHKINSSNPNAASIQYTLQNQQQAHLSSSSFNNSNDESSLRLTSKFNSKYASSNYLNEYNLLSRQTSQALQQGHQKPKRRTPRNAQEFLMAAGVADPETFLNKEYYVGSMLNLSEFISGNNPPIAGKNSTSKNSINLNSSMASNELAYVNLKRRNSMLDSTSVSLANLTFLNNNFSNNNNNNSNNQTTSNKINGPMPNNNIQSGPVGNSITRNKHRSATTAIITLSSSSKNSELINYDSSSMTDENPKNKNTTGHLSDGLNSNGSSSVASDTSSSPTPLLNQKTSTSSAGHQYHNQQQTLNSISNSNQQLGPLMSAVSKAGNESSLLLLSSPLSNKNSSNNNINNINNNIKMANSNKIVNDYLRNHLVEQQRFDPLSMDNEYDDYEYLERNFGAEPPGLTTTQTNKINDTTTNTNVTDYYTDESNSCNNDDFHQHSNNVASGAMIRQQQKLNNPFVGHFSNASAALVNNVSLNNNINNLINSANTTSSSTPNSNYNNQFVNGSYMTAVATTTANNYQHPASSNLIAANSADIHSSNGARLVHGGHMLAANNGWDQASIAMSSNSLVSGLYKHRILG